MSIHFLKLGELFKAHAFIRKERTPAWAIALGLALYFQGLSLRRSALILAQLDVRVSHVAILFFLQRTKRNWVVSGISNYVERRF